MKPSRYALQLAAFLPVALAAVAPAQENIWTSHGPTGIGVVNDLAMGETAAYGATTNGVFRSTDGGASWRQSGLAGEHVFQVLARPGSQVVLANVFTGRNTESILYASRNAGETWAPIGGLPHMAAVSIDPEKPSTAYAGARDGTIWRSTDSGASWQPWSRTPTGSWPLTFSFDSVAIYILSFDDSDGRYKYYRSGDGGVSWAPVPSPVGPMYSLEGGASPGVVYAGATDAGGSTAFFCRSADSAATWTCSNFEDYPASIVEIPGGGPTSPARVVVATGAGIYVSGDQGLTWARVTDRLAPGHYFAALASDATGSLALASMSTGILRSQDRGGTWTAASAGLQAPSISALALDPQQPATVWAAGIGLTEPSVLFRSTDGGLSWSPAGGAGSPPIIRTLVVAPENSSTLYAGTRNSSGESDVYRSEDGGGHWTPSGLGHGTNALAVDPESSDRVWVGSDRALFRSNDGARTWEPTPITQAVYSLLFDRRRPGTIYAGSYYAFDYDWGGYRSGALFESRDGGASFRKFDQDFQSNVVAIVADPFADNALYVGTRAGGIFRSADGETSWRMLADIDSLNSLVADPIRPDRLYASTGSGVYRSVDGAQTWQRLSAGLGSLHGGPLVIPPDGRRLHLGTNGGGVFELELEGEGPPERLPNPLPPRDRRPRLVNPDGVGRGPSLVEEVERGQP